VAKAVILGEGLLDVASAFLMAGY